MSEPKGGNQWGSQQANGKAMRGNEGRASRLSNKRAARLGSIVLIAVLARTYGAEADGLRDFGWRKGGVPQNDGTAVLPFGARPLLTIFVEFADLPYPNDKREAY